ncbi:hypothetical protein ACHAXR_010313 [Thalassiosira sp. AJA248-18]
MQEEHEQHRHLLNTLDDNKLMEEFDSKSVRVAALAAGLRYRDEGVYHRRQGVESRKLHTMPTTKQQQQELESPTPTTHYTLHDAIHEAKMWEHTFALLIYDPPTDSFIGHYSTQHRRESSSKKLSATIPHFVSLLRQTFPNRFQGSDSDELVIAVGSGDYPHVKLDMLPYGSGVAPVLQFGSVFRDSGIYPNMIPMPMPGTHLWCFEQWARFGRICSAFHDELDEDTDDMQEWDNLIPQLIWRGTDFSYLPTLTRTSRRLSAPINNRMERMVRKSSLERRGSKLDKKIAVTGVLREMYDGLLPRWKAVVLSAEAELEVELKNEQQESQLPWADIKFSRHMNNGILPLTMGSKRYKPYEDVGIATGNYMARPELAKYKYHIDLGGGGGTTWTGTTEKLAMPGLLFHHVTPTKDYIHDRLKPWIHFIPVSPDLRDLKEKFDWAEDHPQYAKRIAHQATEFMRHLGTEEGFRQMFEEDFVEPMRRVIESYTPVSSTHPGMTWKDVLQLEEETSDSTMVPVIRCRIRYCQNL